jgi:hypothetical protein
MSAPDHDAKPPSKRRRDRAAKRTPESCPAPDYGSTRRARSTSGSPGRRKAHGNRRIRTIPLAAVDRGIMRERKIQGIRPVVLTSLGARTEVITAAEILLLKHGMAFAAEEEVSVLRAGLAPTMRQREIEALRLMVGAAMVAVTPAEAHARRATIPLHVAALDAEMPSGLSLSHANTFSKKAESKHDPITQPARPRERASSHLDATRPLFRKPPPSGRGCASCAGRTAPGSPPPIPSPAGTVLRSGTPAQAVRR